MSASIIVTVFVAGFAGGLLAASQNPAPPALPAERVTGIGGVFFKAQDPKALGAWYREKLGISMMDGGQFALFRWRDGEDPSRKGTTVWSLFRSESNYFAPGKAAFMVNYRVKDHDRMLAQLRTLGVTVDPKVVDDFNGRFGWAVDPEGNKIELWEPKEGY